MCNHCIILNNLIHRKRSPFPKGKASRMPTFRWDIVLHTVTRFYIAKQKFTFENPPPPLTIAPFFMGITLKIRPKIHANFMKLIIEF